MQIKSKIIFHHPGSSDHYRDRRMHTQFTRRYFSHAYKLHAGVNSRNYI